MKFLSPAFVAIAIIIVSCASKKGIKTTEKFLEIITPVDHPISSDVEFWLTKGLVLVRQI